MKRNLAEIEAELYDNDQVLCSEANIIYYTFSGSKTNKDLYYPDFNNFYDKQEEGSS